MLEVWDGNKNHGGASLLMHASSGKVLGRNKESSKVASALFIVKRGLKDLIEPPR